MRTVLVACLAVMVALAVGCGAKEGAPQNTLRWSTATEEDNYGFDVYRGPGEDGPFEVINAEPVAGAGTTDLPQDYVYVDRDVESGTAYYYYIESISMTGQRKRATPVVRAVATAVSN